MKKIKGLSLVTLLFFCFSYEMAIENIKKKQLKY
jgi:hypothetical protein